MFRSLAFAALGLMVVAPAVQARGIDAWSFQGGAATDNRSKDASKSDGDPYVYGTALWSTQDGRIYAGTGFETIDASTGSRLEIQAIAGVRSKAAGLDFDLRAAFKQQIDARPQTDDDNWEFTANLSRKVGRASARLQLQASPDGAGSVHQWSWIEGRLGWALTHQLTANAAVGRREQNGAVDYTGWNAGLTYTVSPAVSLDLRWYDTDAEVPGAQYVGALVAGITVVY
ncbi:hypothetical protein BH10PSE2_BH10PSE2_29080 [soil metagenome]